MEREQIDRLLAELEKQFAARQEIVDSGGCTDIRHYAALTGVMAGLEIAGDLVKKFAREDVDEEDETLGEPNAPKAG